MDVLESVKITPFQKKVLNGLIKTKSSLRNHIDQITNPIGKKSYWNIHFTVPKYFSDSLEVFKRILEKEGARINAIDKLQEDVEFSLEFFRGGKEFGEFQIPEGLNKLEIRQKVFEKSYKYEISINERIMPVYSSPEWLNSFYEQAKNRKGRIYYHEYLESQLTEVNLKDYFLDALSPDQILRIYKVRRYNGNNIFEDVLLDGARVIRLPFLDFLGTGSDKWLLKNHTRCSYIKASEMDSEIARTYIETKPRIIDKFIGVESLISRIIQLIEKGFFEEVKAEVKEWPDKFLRFKENSPFVIDEFLNALSDVERIGLDKMRVVSSEENDQSVKNEALELGVESFNLPLFNGYSDGIQVEKHIDVIEEVPLLKNKEIEKVQLEREWLIKNEKEEIGGVAFKEKGKFETFILKFFGFLIFAYVLYLALNIVTGVLYEIAGLINVLVPIIVIGALVYVLLNNKK